MLTRDELLTQIHDFDLDAYANLIMSGVKTAIHIRRERVDESRLPLGASKLGGSPDVPADFTWPLYQNKPLTFMGQFRLSEVASHDVDKVLPPHGMLYVFYDADSQPSGFEEGAGDATRILYLPETNLGLQRFPHLVHEGEYGIVKALPPCSIQFAPLTTPQDTERFAAQTWHKEEGRHILDRYADFYKEVMRLQGLNSQGDFPPYHWLLGNAYAIQNDPVPVGSHLLLQLDSDWNDQSLNVMWGDVGVLYFCIGEDELAVRDFSKVTCELECY